MQEALDQALAQVVQQLGAENAMLRLQLAAQQAMNAALTEQAEAPADDEKAGA